MTQKLFRPNSLLNRILWFLSAFAVSLLLQIGISYYNTHEVMEPMERRTENILAISNFMNAAERLTGTLDTFLWDRAGAAEANSRLYTYKQETSRALAKIQLELGESNEEQYLLAMAAKTTYASYCRMLDSLDSYLEAGAMEEASELYFGRMRSCGRYLMQYSRQLMEQAIQDNYTGYQKLIALSNRLRIAQTLSILLCIALGIPLMLSVNPLLGAVRQLSAASREISQGHLDTPDLSRSDDNEIGDMVLAFNEMKHSMKRQVELLEENNQIQQALLRKENEALELQNHMERSQLQLLRSQVDPHFLFNTLNAIMYTARQEAADKTHDLIGALSRLFRYSLGSNAAQVSLAREMHIIDSFYSLYRARFGERVYLEWNIMDDIDPQTVLMPSFILQPLVENAFRHGIVPKEGGGTVTMHVYAADSVLYIEVEDDGVGMKAEDLAALQEKLKTSDIPSSHIGVYNVAARTRMLGPDYGLSFQSWEGRGTLAVLRLPLILEEEDYDAEDADC